MESTLTSARIGRRGAGGRRVRRRKKFLGKSRHCELPVIPYRKEIVSYFLHRGPSKLVCIVIGYFRTPGPRPARPSLRLIRPPHAPVPKNHSISTVFRRPAVPKPNGKTGRAYSTVPRSSNSPSPLNSSLQIVQLRDDGGRFLLRTSADFVRDAGTSDKSRNVGSNSRLTMKFVLHPYSASVSKQRYCAF